MGISRCKLRININQKTEDKKHVQTGEKLSSTEKSPFPSQISGGQLNLKPWSYSRNMTPDIPTKNVSMILGLRHFTVPFQSNSDLFFLEVGVVGCDLGTTALVHFWICGFPQKPWLHDGKNAADPTNPLWSLRTDDLWFYLHGDLALMLTRIKKKTVVKIYGGTSFGC